MVRDYELMYIVRPDVDEDGLRAAVDSVKGLIEAQGGEVTRTTMWGKRRLAYEVKHLRDGHYVIVEMHLDGGKVAPLERLLRIHDTVFRHLLVVQEVPSAATDGEIEGALDGEGEPGGTATPRSEAPAPAPEPAADDDADPDADADEDEDEDESDDELADAVPAESDEEE
jgi:small subunit ribosomal protein S6